MLIDNIFFNSRKFSKTKAFDSYSKNPIDIYNFYLLKKDEISENYGNSDDLPIDIIHRCKVADTSNINDLTMLLQIDNKAFDLFIIGFIFFISDNLLCAKKCLEKSYILIAEENDITALTNCAFLKMQISQIYDQLKNRKKALTSLLEIHNLYKKHPVLFETADSLIASVFFRMSIYSIRVYKTYNISHTTTFLSITYRERFRDRYEKFVLEQYLATAYRNYAPTFADKNTRYYFYMEALKNRVYVERNNNDQFNKVELFYLLSDISRFLITENYNIARIKKYSRMMLKVICSMNLETRKTHTESFVKYSIMLSKFFFIKRHFEFFPWLTIASHFVKTCKSENLKQEFNLYKIKVNQFYPEN